MLLDEVRGYLFPQIT